uniref:Peptidase M13 C-terminal domain-containing protein n=1 Tax=Stomoxys calcitrans TaxID=35570 RepID=A0A1I8PWW1_STOCA
MEFLRLLLLLVGWLALLWRHNVHGLPAAPTLPEVLNNNEEGKDIVRYAKSAEIRNYLKPSEKPCDNFYDFTCGNYYRINPPNMLPYQSNTFQTISGSLGRKIATLLKTDDAADTVIDKKVKRFFESCLKTEALKPHYAAKLKAIIGEFGQMPVLEGDRWRETDFDWLKTVASIAYKYDIRIIVGHTNQVDISNNTVNRMHILMQDMPLESTAIYVEDVHASFREARQKVMAVTLQNALGVNSKLAKQTAQEIFKFETDLFAGFSNDEDEETEEEEEEEKNAIKNKAGEALDDDDDQNEVAHSDLGDLKPNLTTIEEMQSKYFPKLDVKRMLNISLGYMPKDPVYDLIEDEVDNLETVLRETPLRTVANYIFYYLIDSFLIPVPKQKHELETMCIRRTKSHFAKVLDSMVYRKYATDKTEQDVNYMWQTIRSTFRNMLESDKLTWMRRETRNYALEKLKTIRLEINSYKGENFTEEFNPLTIGSQDYIENLKSLQHLRALKSRAKLREAPKTYDDAESLSYTPVYITTENLIKVPVSVLQPFFLWSDHYPNALKFGTLGFLVSHELIHGFDEEGRTYDTRGNKHEWWDADSNSYFGNQTECFAHQYGNFIFNGRKLPELSSQSENIADNGGIRLAYDAYLNWYEDAARSFQNMNLESLPRLNYTSKQLFFISYGQLWCSATHPALQDYVSSTDQHVPEKFRVLGPLKNLEEFSKEFNCPVGSPMNPTKKCIIY